MKRADEELAWSDVSLYRNPFDDVIARIAFDGTGMYGRENSPASPEFATSGSFAKCWIREGEDISLLKRGSEGYANASRAHRVHACLHSCWPSSSEWAVLPYTHAGSVSSYDSPDSSRAGMRQVVELGGLQQQDLECLLVRQRFHDVRALSIRFLA